MKKLTAMFTTLILNICMCFATEAVNACYKSENVDICQLIGVDTMFYDFVSSYKTIEETIKK